MAADRHIPTILTDPGGIDDDLFAQDADDEVHGLWDRSLCFLSSVAGTNTLTALCTPTLDAYAQAMRFAFIPVADNTAAATLNVDGKGAVEIRDEDGNPLLGGEIVTGRLTVVTHDGTYLRLSGGSGGSDSGSGVPGLIIEDQKAVGTDAGTFTSGAFRTRDLNTAARNVIAGAALASNQITLQPGTYLVHFSAPGFSCGAHVGRFRNVTDGSTPVNGTSEDTDQGSNSTTRSEGWGVFTIATAKVFELQHRCTTTQATDGFGGASNLGNAVELYSYVHIWEVGAIDSAVVGRHGGAITVRYQFSTTVTDADPGNGKLRLNNATQSSATLIIADLLDYALTDWTDALDSIGGGQVRLVKEDDPTKWIVFSIAALVSAVGYRKYQVSLVDASAASPFADGDLVLMAFGTPGAAALMTGSSTTSLTPSIANKVFTVEAGRQWTTGMRLRATSVATPSVWMDGTIVSYSGTTLTLAVDTIGVASAKADWAIGVSGQPGAVTSVYGQTGAILLSQRVATASPDTMLAADDHILVNFAGAVTVNLITAVGRLRPVTIVDISGAAGTNNVTIDGAGTETILGGLTRLINTDYGKLVLYPLPDGSGWY